MATVAKRPPGGTNVYDSGCRNMIQSPPLNFRPETAWRPALRKHYASAKLKLTIIFYYSIVQYIVVYQIRV